MSSGYVYWGNEDTAALIAVLGEVADALKDQKPRMVVVPLVVGNVDLTAERAHQLAVMLKDAFEEALK